MCGAKSRMAAAQAAHEVACSAYNLALMASYDDNTSELKSAMQCVNEKLHDIAEARLMIVAVEEKIFGAIKKSVRARMLPFTTRIMETLPPELRDLIY